MKARKEQDIKKVDLPSMRLIIGVLLFWLINHCIVMFRRTMNQKHVSRVKKEEQVKCNVCKISGHKRSNT